MDLTTQHPEFATLADLAEHGSEGEALGEPRAHVAACSECASQVKQLQQVIGLMRTDTAEDAPHNALARALNLFRPRASESARAAQRETGVSVLRRVLGALSFDSRQTSHAYGVRAGAGGGAPSSARQLLYGVGDDHELDLRIAPAGDMWVVSGQVLGECASGGEIELSGTGVRVDATLNDTCEFTLPPVAAGSYRLRLRLGEMEADIPELELRA